MQSTRYCNYSKDRFGNEVIYVFPQWAYWRYGFTSQEKTPECDENLDTIVERLSKTDKKFKEYIAALKDSEKRYLNMLAEETEEEKNGTPITAQFARGVLPLDIKTEFVLWITMPFQIMQERTHKKTSFGRRAFQMGSIMFMSNYTIKRAICKVSLFQ